MTQTLNMTETLEMPAAFSMSSRGESEKSLYETGDFMELIIKHLANDKKVLAAAKKYKLTPEDFGGLDIYKAFVKIFLEVGEAPVNPSLFFTKIKECYAQGSLSKTQEPQILEFWFWLDNAEPLNPNYILEHLPKFLRHRRFTSLMATQKNNPEELTANLNALAFDFKHSGVGSDEVSYSPFTSPVLTGKREAFGTGFPRIDQVAFGLALQEYGIILGYSGSGKTAVAVHSALQNVLQGIRVMYLSLEEPGANICNRFYSNYFKINYTELHEGKGSTQTELQSKLSDMRKDEVDILKNLRIEDLRNVTPLTADYIAEFLDRYAAEKGFVPQLVYIDQMDYLDSKQKCDATWQKYEKIAFEVDDLTNHLIAGEHKFSVWLLHQATGKMKRYFTNADISGFKGIIKPADFVLGIGKDKPDDQTVSLFSLKCRHTKNFNMDFYADLAYMKFDDRTVSGEARVNLEEKEIKRHLKILPPPGGKFK